MVPHVLRLPAQDDESAFRVELMVGRTVQVDERDRHFFSGRIQAETIKGRGYARYTGNKLGMIAGTRMAVDPTAAKVSRFFTRGGGTLSDPLQQPSACCCLRAGMRRSPLPDLGGGKGNTNHGKGLRRMRERASHGSRPGQAWNSCPEEEIARRMPAG